MGDVGSNLFYFTFKQFFAFDGAGENVAFFDWAYPSRCACEDIVASLELEEFGDVANDGIKRVDHETAISVLNCFAIEVHFKFNGLTVG